MTVVEEARALIDECRLDGRDHEADVLEDDLIDLADGEKTDEQVRADMAWAIGF